MIAVVESSSFLRAYRKFLGAHPELDEVIADRLKIFIADPFDARLKTHKLTGQLSQYWAFSINWSYRVVFKFAEPELAILIDIGSHDEVY